MTFADSEADLGDTDTLFEEYANGIFYPNTGMSAKARKAPRVSAGSKLTDNNLVVYTLLRERTAEVMINQYPEEMVERAVKGMLPKGRLGRAMIKKLFVYAGSEHKQQAQQPKELK